MFVPLNRVAHFMPIRLHKYGSIYVEGANCQEHRRRGAICFVHCQVRPDVVNFNAAISALAVAGRASQAQELLQSMAPRRCQEGGPGQVKQQATGLLAIHKFRWSPSSHLGGSTQPQSPTTQQLLRACAGVHGRLLFICSKRCQSPTRLRCSCKWERTSGILQLLMEV